MLPADVHAVLIRLVRLVSAIFFATVSFSAAGASRLWEAADAEAASLAPADRWVRPTKSHAFRTEPRALRDELSRAPREFTPAAGTPLEVEMPMPDGTLARFNVWESPVMAPELAAKFPEIKTYSGQGIDDPAATVRFDTTPAGFHAQILSPSGAVYIDPARRGDARLHLAYYKRDFARDEADFRCLTEGDGAVLFQPASVIQSGGSLRTYRLAVSATGEYTQFHGGTVADGLAAIVTAINRINGIYERDLTIRLMLVANNDQLVFTNPNTDPFSNSNPTSLLSQNQSTIDSIIGEANYDLGHVFGTGGGGLSSLAVVCLDGAKARSETGLSAPTGDPFYVDFVAHEIGHQFGANHTYNGLDGNCGAQRNASTAYEPGSGTTIMGYAGICGADDLQAHSDPFFHFNSIEAIQFYTTVGFGKDCPVITATSNTPPAINAGPDHIIPRSTPFTLTATGSDTNGDTLTFCWEERDLGSGQNASDPDNGSSPLFRSFAPGTSPARTFPKLTDILNNTTSLGEKLPVLSRTMNFRVTARDNRAGGGGVATDDVQVTVVGTAGPFVITAPNTAVTWSGSRTVTWNVAGTTASPINAATVNILLSTNGGSTFPVVLATNTPNDGSEAIVLPNLSTTQARIKVQAAGNIFFDISDSNFSISTFVPSPLVVADGATLLAEDCLPGNGVVDPGEVVTVSLALRNTGLANASNVVASLAAIGGVVPLSSTQTYGLLIAGGPAVARPFTFLATQACGATATARMQLQNGPFVLPYVTNFFPLGTASAATNSFASGGAITIPSRDAATPYPSTLNVSGLAGAITKVTVTLSNLSHTQPDDVDVLLVGPGGQSVVLMSDAGGGSDLSNVSFTFDDDAANSLPDSSELSSGLWKPTNIGADETFQSPAPSGPYGATLAVFDGLSPNGAWSLYVFDDANQRSGSIASGWRLTFVTQVGPVCCSNLPVPSLTIADAAIAEGNAGRTNLDFPLRLSRPSAQVVSVNFATASGSALAAADFASTNGTAQFAAGQTNHTLRVGVLGDALLESNETFLVTLSAPANATLARAAATGTILDDEVLLSATSVSNLHVRLQFNTVTGAIYRVERSDFLPNTNAWTTVTGAALLPGNGGILQVFDTNGMAQPQRFYRVRQVGP